jgi:hypothetical protein
MRQRQLFLSLLTVVALFVLPPAPSALAAPPRGDEVIFGDDFVLSEGEHIDGDLVVIGGNLTLRPSSRVTGGVTALGGRATVDGIVEGDLVVLGGDLDLGPQARVNGDTVALGGRLQRSEGAQTGDVVQGLPLRNIRFWWGWPPSPPFFGFIGPDATATTLATTLLIALALALLGVAIANFWPAQTAQVAETVVAAPLPSLGVGCLLYPLSVSLVFFILITICLAPLAPAVVLVVVAASLLGWVALGSLWGRRLAVWTGWRRATTLAVTGVGVFTLTLLAALLGSLPCLGAILVLGGASIGVGAVTLSRFGTNPYRTRQGKPSSES